MLWLDRVVHCGEALDDLLAMRIAQASARLTQLFSCLLVEV